MSLHGVPGVPLPSMLPSLTTSVTGSGKGGAWETFSTVLAQQVKETDRLQKESKDLTERALLGNAGVSLHEAQIAASEAELHLRLLLQVRNKALEVYHEIMTMPTA
ncbi:MAG: flagellar hook-basal body complex protein FliE [Magnetococcales bacterium]|nr:flagellar hook-basal body complex protein FliE [Magnetococcales bacterium]MBF0114466.1 flagellar hook-basal body complex protein FliE [Magnetococcales bacterium]